MGGGGAMSLASTGSAVFGGDVARSSPPTDSVSFGRGSSRWFGGGRGGGERAGSKEIEPA